MLDGGPDNKYTFAPHIRYAYNTYYIINAMMFSSNAFHYISVRASDNFSLQNNGIKSAHVGKQWVFGENNVFLKSNVF